MLVEFMGIEIEGNKMKISKYFFKKEFICKCLKCDKSTVDAELLFVLEDVREHFGKLVFINSGHRCKEYNAKIGGRKNSKHLDGIAADIVVDGVNPFEVSAYFEKRYPSKYGIGRYETFTHIDVREKRSRW